MIILTLDFEGSLKTGIREIGAVISEGTAILAFEDRTIEGNDECIQSLNRILSSPPELFISHNVHIERNLLKKYLPYRKCTSNFTGLEWGPWLDTKQMYKVLYPQINQYGLQYLTNLFVKKESEQVCEKYCMKEKMSHHNALYDAICTFLLFKRVAEKVNIGKFIH